LRDTVALEQTNRESTSDIAAEGRKRLHSTAEWQRIKQLFFATANASEAQHSLAKLIEAAIADAYQSSLALALPENAVLLATGNFARSELFPFAESEFVVLYEGDTLQRLNEAKIEFVRLLWERGVRPNQRVCTIEQYFASGDRQIDRTLNLLNRRFVVGNPSCAAVVDARMTALLTKDAHTLAQGVVALARARHAKYRNEPSQREHNVKDAPGGLQDVRVIADLETLSSGQRKSNPKLEAAAVFLSSVQCFLQYWAADEHSILDDAAREAFVQHFAPGITASTWMREYFGQARLVYHQARRLLDSSEAINSALLDGMRGWQSRLSNTEFSVVQGRAYLRRPGELDHEMVIRLLEFIARHDIPPAIETERRLEAVKDTLAAYWRESNPLWPAIRKIFSLPHAGRALRVLDYTGLLSSIFPEWATIEGAIVSDPAHPYTLDVHTLITVEQICELPQKPDRQRFAELLAQLEDRAVLVFAVLFHEMGRTEGDTDSSRTAASLSGEASTRIQMPAPERDTVSFMIEQQFSLSDTLRGRDLDDPATVRTLSREIGTIERLKMLTVMTYARIAATYSETAVAWRLDQLWKIYLGIERELTRGLEADRIQELPETFSQYADFIRGFPMRYLRARGTDEIAAHTQLFQLAHSSGAAVELRQIEGAHELTVIARDRPALFASFAGGISSFGLEILRAEAFSNTNGIVLDTFVIADPKRTFQLNPSEAERFQDLIRRIALGKIDVRRLFRYQEPLPPKRRTIAPRVEFDAGAHETATLVEIVAEDQPGLLYKLASVFSSNACDIDTVLVDTKAGRAIDVFYVAEGGKKLSPELTSKLKDQLLAVCTGKSSPNL
jgi:[protein-PII] uridylyltransferase